MEKDGLKRIEELQGLTFNIESYQRGYKWGIQEILSLLDDIDEFNINANNFYCLQPLVLKKIYEDTFELIDGQQRCTSVFLILKCLDELQYFNLAYGTRADETSENLNIFLNQIENFFANNPFTDFTLDSTSDVLDFTDIENKIYNYWKEIAQGYNTVDNFFFYKAFTIMKKWMEENTEKKLLFKNKLLKYTKVIWYEEEDIPNKSEKTTFIDFNNGKISLDQAELIKALFVLQINKISDSTMRNYEENQFAEDWNMIEHQMQDKKFWSFVNSNKDEEDVANKINLLLQLHKGFGKSEDKMFAYRSFDKEFKALEKQEDNNRDFVIDQVLDDWEKIENLFSKLEEWFKDPEFYNIVGALIQLTDTNIKDLVEPKNEKGEALSFPDKKALKKHFRRVLKKYFCENDKFKKDFELSEIKYGHKNLRKVLVLHNIATISIEEKDEYFPFHKYSDNLISWNHEHILAKNDKGFETLEEIEMWHNEIIEILNDLKNTDFKEKLDGLKDLIEKFDLKSSIKIQKELASNLNELFLIDNIDNMCLLDSKTNIRIGCKPFCQKRNFIFGLDEEELTDVYIPRATQNIFAKKIVPKVQTSFWSFNDREFYKQNIDNYISQFIGRKQ